MNMETGYELNVPVGDGNKDVKAIISNNEVIWERAIPTPKSGVAPLSFRTTRAKPLLDWSITGKTYQALTPTPEPQIGNNKLDNSKIEKSATVTNFAYTDSSVSFGSMTVGSTINSAEIKAEDTSYAFSFSGDTSKVSFTLKCYNSSHTYLGDANKLFDEENRAVMVLLSNTDYIRLVIMATVQGVISLSNLMLNKGNTISPFEPFVYLLNEAKGVGDKTENLLHTTNIAETTKQGVTYRIENQTLYLNGTCDEAGFEIVLGDSVTLEAGVYTNSFEGFTGNKMYYSFNNVYSTMCTSGVNLSKTFTISEKTVLKKPLVWINPNTVFKDVKIVFMLNSGSEPLPYKPYGYEIPVVDEGDNLLDVNFTNGTTGGISFKLNNDKSITVSGIRQSAVSKVIGSIIVKADEQYFVNLDGFTGLTIDMYNAVNSKSYYTSPFTATSDGVVTVSLKGIANGEEVSGTGHVWVNKGSEPLPYTPYREPITTPIYLDTPLMTDEILKSDGTRDVKWKKVVFTGEEQISYESNYNRFFITTKDINVPSYRIPVYCNKFDSTNINISRDNLCFVYSNRLMIYYEAFGDSITTLKMWLQQEYTNGTPLTIYYPLTEPTSETISVPQIPTFKGNNVIDTDTEVKPSNLNITYLSSGFEPQPLKTADGQILYTNDNQPLNTLE